MATIIGILKILLFLYLIDTTFSYLECCRRCVITSNIPPPTEEQWNWRPAICGCPDSHHRDDGAQAEGPHAPATTE